MRKQNGLNFERLENRRLLAADLGADIMATCDFEAPQEETCMVAPEVTADSCEMIVDEITPDTESEQLAGPTDQLVDEAGQIASETVVGEPGPILEAKLDLSDGMDGYFGELNADNPSDTLAFNASENGMVDVVVASSFGESTTNLEVHNSRGEMITAAGTEGLEGFQTLSFQADAGESYMLTISSEDGGEGRFQVTVGFEAEAETQIDESAGQDDMTDTCTDDQDGGEVIEDPVADVDEGPATDDNSDPVEDDTPIEDPVAEDETDDSAVDAGPVDDLGDDVCVDEAGEVLPTDLHGNEIGSGATPLDFVDNVAEISGDLEIESDMDVFQMTAEEGGQVMLYAGESSAENVDLDIQVFDSNGELVVDGATNEAVKISFEATQGETYYIALNSDADQTGAYSILVETPGPQEVQDDHTNELGEDATVILTESGAGLASGVIETETDTDAFQVTADQSGEMFIDLNIESEGNAADAGISVYDQGELIASGSTNQTVGLVFDAVENTDYQIVIDSLNDTPMNYQLATTESTLIDAGLESELFDNDDELVDEIEDDLLEDGLICDLPVAEAEIESDLEEPVDVVFSEFGEEESESLVADDANSLEDFLNDFQWAFSFDGERFYSRVSRA